MPISDLKKFVCDHCGKDETLDMNDATRVQKTQWRTVMLSNIFGQFDAIQHVLCADCARTFKLSVGNKS